MSDNRGTTRGLPWDERGAVVINSELSDPVGDYVFSYLLHRSGEAPFHDFKWTVNTAKDSNDFPKIIKDVYAFSNYGGGWFVLGVKENDHSDPKIRGRFVKSGLPKKFQLEDSSLQEKINSRLSEPIGIQYNEFLRTINGEERKFALIYFPPSSKILVPTKDITYRTDGREKIAVKKNTVYTRRGTQSIPASALEKDLIKKRLEKEDYRLSILSGEPDEIPETIYSNLFEVKRTPAKICIGTPLHGATFGDSIETLRRLFPNRRYFPLECVFHEGKLITFANLGDFTDMHSNLVDTSSIRQEDTRRWLEDQDKAKIVMQLLSKRLGEGAFKMGMRFDRRKKKLYYAATGVAERKEEWRTRHKGVLKKQVVKTTRSAQLDHNVYLHQAAVAKFMFLGGDLYLRLNPTMLVTIDGMTPITGIPERALITSQSYRIYNKQQLSNILFWIDKLGGGMDVSLGHDLVISRDPIQVRTEIGIAWDFPVADWKKFAEEFEEGVESGILSDVDGERPPAEDDAYDF